MFFVYLLGVFIIKTLTYGTQVECDNVENVLRRKLRNFDVLDIDSIQFRTKRYADPFHIDHLEELRFKTLGNTFHLALFKTQILSADFQLSVIGKEGKVQNPKWIPQSHIYVGNIYGNADSRATLYWDDQNHPVLFIATTDETYYIEPLQRYDRNASSNLLLSYRFSDMVSSLPCPGPPKLFEASNNQDFNLSLDNTTSSWNKTNLSSVKVLHSRQKREVDLESRKLCRVILVADTNYFLNIGQGSVLNTQIHLIGLMNQINTIYKQTVWSEHPLVTGIGFEISQLIIHDDYTAEPGHYNSADRYKLTISDLLERLSKSFYQNSACLVHLFTFWPFSALGLAHLASWRPWDVGGICSPPIHGTVKENLNTAVTTSQDNKGNRVLSLQTMLTTAHELGHNFGSPHDDPGDPTCSPGNSNGGHFIMYPSSQQGFYSNNVLFSPCSKKAIFEVLKTRADCFSEPNPFFSFCGNGKLEAGEQCDPGSYQDPCCTRSCQLAPDADCSPYSQECCVNCSLAPRDTMCAYLDKGNNFGCTGQAYCSGYEYKCSRISHVQDNTSCADGGECQRGVCRSFCEMRQMEACICIEETSACQRCCRSPGSQECVSFNVSLQDGRTCYQGYCQLGVCVRNPSPIEKLWSALQSQITDSFAKFIENNIVYTITLLMIIVWLVAIKVISVLDDKEEKEDAVLRKRKRVWRDHVIIPNTDTDNIDVFPSSWKVSSLSPSSESNPILTVRNHIHKPCKLTNISRSLSHLPQEHSSPTGHFPPHSPSHSGFMAPSSLPRHWDRRKDFQLASTSLLGDSRSNAHSLATQGHGGGVHWGHQASHPSDFTVVSPESVSNDLLPLPLPMDPSNPYWGKQNDGNGMYGNDNLSFKYETLRNDKTSSSWSHHPNYGQREREDQRTPSTQGVASCVPRDSSVNQAPMPYRESSRSGLKHPHQKGAWGEDGEESPSEYYASLERRLAQMKVSEAPHIPDKNRELLSSNPLLGRTDNQPDTTPAYREDAAASTGAGDRWDRVYIMDPHGANTQMEDTEI